MFGDKHYVPILKGKAGEFGALAALDPAVKRCLTPLIDVVPEVVSYKESKDPTVKQLVRTVKALGLHLEDTVAKLHKAWGTEAPVFLDLYWTPGTVRVADGRSAIEHALQAARAVGLPVIPVTRLDRDIAHQAAVRSATATGGRGMCVRLQRADFARGGTPSDRVHALAREFDVPPELVDIIIDLRAIAPEQVATEAIVARSLVKVMADAARWRTITLAGSAFPLYLADRTTNSTSLRARGEWSVWTDVRAAGNKLARVPTFGDYGVNHPDLPDDVEPWKMTPSTNLRYTANADWIIIKGQSIKKSGTEPFRTHCAEIISRSEYSGAAFSWGDGYIKQCADGEITTGNGTTWRKIATSHHLTFVVRQIASLP